MIARIKNILNLPRAVWRKFVYQEKIVLEMLRLQEIYYRDMLDVSSGFKKIRHNETITLKTDHPVAYDSPDHTNPFGTIQDNTRNYGFYNKCRSLYGADARFLDLGCSGGGLVFEFALNGHIAIGLEGSNRSQKMGRANWRTIPQNLFTCDITKPFELTNAKGQQVFEVISCWEVFEHIPEVALAPLFKNIKKHLAAGGIFVGSISKDPADPLHATVKPNDWWVAKFKENGLAMVIGYDDALEFGEFCRGIKGGMYDSHDYRADSHKGLHFVARHM